MISLFLLFVLVDAYSFALFLKNSQAVAYDKG